MNFLPIFFQHYIVLIITLSFFYFIGHILFYFLRNYFSLRGTYLNCFAKILLGIVSFVTFYSIIITHFKTVNLAFLLIPGFLFYEIKKNRTSLVSQKNIVKVFNWKNIFEFLLVTFLVCGWESVFVLSNHPFPFVIPHFDHTDYSTISQFLNLTGEENVLREANMYDNAFKGLFPYHYFELWLNAAIAKCFGLLYSSSLLLVTYPLFYFLFYLGVNALWEEFGSITLYKKIFSLLFLFFGAFCFPVYEKIPFVNQYFWGLVIKSYPAEFLAKKMIFTYIFIIPALLCIRRKYYSIGFLFLLTLPVVFAATIPALFGGSFVFILIAWLLKLIPFTELKKTFLYLTFLGVFILLLYKFWGNHLFMAIEGNMLNFFTKENSELKKQWADVVWLGETLPFQIMLAYLPFIIISGLLFSSRKLRRELLDFRIIILIVTIIIIFGAAIWAFLLPVQVSFQFYSSLITLLNMLCIFILIKMFSSSVFINEMNLFRKRMIYTILFLALSSQCVVAFNEQWQRKQETENNYSSEYLSEIQKVKNEIKNPIGACFLAKETPLLAPFRIQIGLYLKFIQGFENLVNISVLDKEYENPFDRELLKSSIFFRFVMKQKANGTFKSISQSQLDFINKFKIDYIVAQKNSLLSPAILQREKKVITDSQSQEKFILLN